jgi:hypothetical protein
MSFYKFVISSFCIDMEIFFILIVWPFSAGSAFSMLFYILLIGACYLMYSLHIRNITYFFNITHHIYKERPVFLMQVSDNLGTKFIHPRSFVFISSNLCIE